MSSVDLGYRCFGVTRGLRVRRCFGPVATLRKLCKKPGSNCASLSHALDDGRSPSTHSSALTSPK